MRIKKLICILLLVTLVFSTMLPVNAETKGIRIVINGTEVYPDVPAQSIDGRTMVPARFIAEPLGATVVWDSGKRFVIIKSLEANRANKQYILPEINNTSDIKIFIDGEEIKPDVAPRSFNGRIMVPARFIAEPLGAEVSWNGAEQAVVITKRDVLKSKSADTKTPLFKPTDIFVFDMVNKMNSNDADVIAKTHASVIGSAHPTTSGENDFYKDDLHLNEITDKAHKMGLVYVEHFSLGPPLDHLNLGNSSKCLDIEGNNTNTFIYSLHNPNNKRICIDYVKKDVDCNVDIVCIDNISVNYSMTQWGNGDFSEYSMKDFRAYLGSKYDHNQLNKLGISDLDTFDYGDYIRKNYLELYKKDRIKVPFFTDFSDFELQSGIDFYKALIDEVKAYAQSKGKKISFTTNVNCSNYPDLPIGFPFLEKLGLENMNEGKFDYPPSNKNIAFYKLLNALNKPTSIQPVYDYGNSEQLLVKPDIENIMKIYTAEAYSSGGFTYVPYADVIFSRTENKEKAYSANVEELYPYYDFIYNNKGLYENLNSVSKVALLYPFSVFHNKHTWLAFQNYYGMANMLLDFHYQYDALFSGDDEYIEDKLTLEDLNKYDVIAVSNLFNLTDKQISLLLTYIKNGGNVLAFGSFDTSDTKGLSDSGRQFYEMLIEGTHSYGIGKLIYMKNDIGTRYLETRETTYGQTVSSTLNTLIKDSIITNANRNVVIEGYWNSKARSHVLHLINYNYDSKEMNTIPQKNLTMEVVLKKELWGKSLEVSCLSPDSTEVKKLDFTVINNTVHFTIPRLDTYSVIYIRETV